MVNFILTSVPCQISDQPVLTPPICPSKIWVPPQHGRKLPDAQLGTDALSHVAELHCDALVFLGSKPLELHCDAQKNARSFRCLMKNVGVLLLPSQSGSILFVVMAATKLHGIFQSCPVSSGCNPALRFAKKSIHGKPFQSPRTLIRMIKSFPVPCDESSLQ